jgi:hypothetical protein
MIFCACRVVFFALDAERIKPKSKKYIFLRRSPPFIFIFGLPVARCLIYEPRAREQLQLPFFKPAGRAPLWGSEFEFTK